MSIREKPNSLDIAHLAGVAQSTVSRALRAANIEIDPAFQVGAVNTEQSGGAAIRALLERGLRVDAVFGASDLIAIGAMRALGARRIAVPRDISVVGFDDIPLSSIVSPALTTVAQDTRRAGMLLVETLISQIEGKPAQSITLPTRLVVRQSSIVKRASR